MMIGIMVYSAEGKNIHWQEIESENLAVVEQGLRHLLAQKWQFSSITVDGRKGTISEGKKTVSEHANSILHLPSKGNYSPLFNH